MDWSQSIRTRLRLLFARGAAETRMEEEIGFHIEMETERLVREEGLDRGEARRRALVAFGGVEKTKEELREGRGLAWLSGLRLDLKLGARMLMKYPVLTGASILALAVAVSLAASWFQFMGNITNPTIPLPDGDRVVQLRVRDLEAAANRTTSLHDFEAWRGEVETVDHVSAAAAVAYNVTTESGRFGSLDGARVTPSIFQLTRVQPMLGRTLMDADMEPEAPLVAVLGHGAWQRLFDGSPEALGRTLRLGSHYATVVGVMPPGYGFPVNEEIWTPLRERAVDYARLDGPRLITVGRLAPGASLQEARSELGLIGDRIAAEYPTTHEHLRPQVARFGRGSDMAGPAMLLNVPFLFFLLVVSANVATLLFARTATRQSEIAMRSALGASRRRIIVQLIAESLVLTSAAAALGLAVTHWGFRWAMNLFWQVQQSTPPFWFRDGLALSSVLYVCALAFIGAVIIGGLPGLRGTGSQLRNRLPQPGAGGSGMRFGAVATAVIVVQVALCVAFIPVAITNGRDLLPESDDVAGFPADDFLTGRLLRPEAAGESAGILDEVQRRLAAEPGVTATTRASRIPGFNHPVSAVEVEGDSGIVGVRQLAVDPNFFDVMEARVVQGRAFSETDGASDLDVAIVDESWAAEAFAGSNPLGRRIRYPGPAGSQPGPWHEIVGVVAGMERAVGPGEDVGIYHPLRVADRGGVQLYLRADVLPSSLVPQLHELVSSVDPELALTQLQPLEETWRPVRRANRFFLVGLGVVAAIILLFALIGIYALMSFTVAQRAREIGIRAALGADPRRIILTIFSRGFGQIGLGILVGATLISLTVSDSPEEMRLVAGVAAAMAVVGLLGCLVPAMRALRIQPVDALRAE